MTGHVLCWGQDPYGELGNGSTAGYFDTPIEVLGITNASQVAAGAAHTCALLSSDHVECWGSNGSGQLGNGTTSGYSDTPVEVPAITEATTLPAGGGDNCVVLATSHVDCWGDNSLGELGTGTAWSTVPAEVLIEVVPSPVLTSVSPSEGPASGGTQVTITGTNLSGASAVKFGSTNASSYQVNSASSITAAAPAGSGTVDVTVSTIGGTSVTSPADQYTYVPVVKALCMTNTGTITLSPGLTSVAAAQTVKVKGALSGCSGESFAAVKYTATLKTAGAVSCAVLKGAGETAAGASAFKWTPKAKPSTASGTLSMVLGETPGGPLQGGVARGAYSPLTLSGKMSESLRAERRAGSNPSRRARSLGRWSRSPRAPEGNDDPTKDEKRERCEPTAVRRPREEYDLLLTRRAIAVDSAAVTRDLLPLKQAVTVRSAHA